MRGSERQNQFKSSGSEIEPLLDSRSNRQDETRLLNDGRRGVFKYLTEPSVPMICVVIVLFTFSSGISLAPRLQLIIDLICRDSNDGVVVDRCNTLPETQQRISWLDSGVTVLGCIMATLFSGRIGHLSDQYGRQKVIVGIVGIVLASKILVLILVSPQVLVYRPLFIVPAAALEQLGGGLITLVSVSGAYIADLSGHDDRILKMGVVAGSMYAGLGLGPFVGSILVKHLHSNMIPCVLDIVVLLVLILFCIVILPESRSPRSQSDSQSEATGVEREEKKAGLLRHYTLNLLSPLKLLLVPPSVDLQTNRKSYKKRFELLALLGILTFFLLGSVFMGRIFVLYPIYVFKWTSVDVGFFITIMMVSRAVILFVVSPFLIRFLKSVFKPNEKGLDLVDLSILRVALVFEVIGSLILTFAPNSNTYKFSPFITCFGAMINPSLDSMIIKYAPENKVGQLVGAVSMVKNFLSAIVPSTILLIYSATVQTDPRTVFYGMLIMLSIATIFSLLLGTEKHSDEHSEPQDSDGT